MKLKNPHRDLGLWLDSIHESTQKLAEMNIGAQSYQILSRHHEIRKSLYGSYIDLTLGEPRYRFLFLSDLDGCRKLSHSLFQTHELLRPNIDIVDATGEIANQIIGGAMSQIADDQIEIKLKSPVFVSGDVPLPQKVSIQCADVLIDGTLSNLAIARLL